MEYVLIKEHCCCREASRFVFPFLNLLDTLYALVVLVWFGFDGEGASKLNVTEDLC